MMGDDDDDDNNAITANGESARMTTNGEFDYSDGTTMMTDRGTDGKVIKGGMDSMFQTPIIMQVLGKRKKNNRSPMRKNK